MSEAFGDQKSFLAAEKVAATEKLHFCSGKKKRNPADCVIWASAGEKKGPPQCRMDLRPTHNDLHEAKRACLEASLEAGYEGPEAMELKQSNIKKGVRFCLNKARKSRHANISFPSNRMDGKTHRLFKPLAGWIRWWLHGRPKTHQLPWMWPKLLPRPWPNQWRISASPSRAKKK